MGKILIIIFVVQAILLATHKGEFWPFSIFPMFSEAGQPWSRGLVTNVEVQSVQDSSSVWDVKSLDDVEDQAVPLRSHGIHPIDYANFISKTTDWNHKRVQALRTTFQMEQKEDEVWMANRVTGSLTENDSVTVQVIPMFLFTRDTTYKNPQLLTTKNGERIKIQ